MFESGVFVFSRDIRRYSDLILNGYHGDNLKFIAEANGGDKIGGFKEINIGGVFKNRIKPVNPEIFESENIFIAQDCKKPWIEIFAAFIEYRMRLVIPISLR